MVFGIGTQTNNGLSSGATVLTLDDNPDDADWAGVTTVYSGNGLSYPSTGEDSTLIQKSSCPVSGGSGYPCTFGSFFDSGSNGMFFLDEPTTGIEPLCDGGWYCPNGTETLTGVNEDVNGNRRGLQFDVSDANTLFNANNGNNYVFSDLAAPNSEITNADPVTQAEDGYFDWGLPAFYGRNVYVGIWEPGVLPPTAVPAGPFWAY